MSYWKCSLCPSELPNDEYAEQRKKCHTEKHLRGWNHKGRKNGGGNNTIGIAEFTLIHS